MQCKYVVSQRKRVAHPQHRMHVLSRSGLALCSVVQRPSKFSTPTVSRPAYRKFRAALRLGPRYTMAVGVPGGEDLEAIAKLVEEGRLRAVVDRVFSLEDVRCVSS